MCINDRASRRAILQRTLARLCADDSMPTSSRTWLRRLQDTGKQSEAAKSMHAHVLATMPIMRHWKLSKQPYWQNAEVYLTM